ncbi:MAG: hypothetical protein U0835_09780 [Isosphaeraceae bacterium]
MHQYRTEVVVPPDRYVCLRLPDGFACGRAVVTVEFEGPAQAGTPGTSATPLDHHLTDRDDIEWWEEFEAERER